MKNTLIVIKVLGLCVFIPLCLISFIGFSEGDYFAAVFTFLLGATPSFFIIRSFKAKEKMPETPDTTVQDAKLVTQVSGTNIKPSNNISLFDYNRIKQFQAKQLLESIYILETTKNLDTLSGRMDFVNQIYGNFISASTINSYPGHMAEVIDEYKAMYYDRILTENQVSLLLCPNLENMRLFYSDCVVRCYERYVEQQVSEINKLKTNTAKERRKEDMIKKGYSAKYIFKTHDLPDIGHLDSIENIRKQFYSYQKSE